MPILTGLDWDEGTAFDVQNKGWYEMACLKMDDGKSIPLSIWDPVCLTQGVQSDLASGRSFFAEKYLIILPALPKRPFARRWTQLMHTGFFL